MSNAKGPDLSDARIDELRWQYMMSACPTIAEVRDFARAIRAEGSATDHEPAAAPEPLTDADRVDYLLHHVAGSALRNAGVLTSGDRNLDRKAIDRAIRPAPAGMPASAGTSSASWSSHGTR
jgi:hypothetical protein